MNIYGLIGNPVAHSLSPLMHNAAFTSMAIDARYVAFRVKDLAQAVQGIRGLSIRGVSVTLPFKTAVIAYLDAVDPSARAIGAVNTILNDDGRLTGFNTDWSGLISDLEEVIDLDGKRFAVLGAGGAARAAVFGIIHAGGTPVIVNRSVAKGEALAGEFGCAFYPLSEAVRVEADVLINTTPVGMAPRVDQTPVPPDVIKKFPWVVDVIYTPLMTKLLRDAEAAGCRTRSGLGMFVRQGVEQIRLWTGQVPPVERMRRAVVERLTDAGNEKEGHP